MCYWQRLRPTPSGVPICWEECLMYPPLASIVSPGDVLLSICSLEPCLVHRLAKMARHWRVSVLNVKSTGVTHVPIVVLFDRVGSSPVTMLLLWLHERGSWLLANRFVHWMGEYTVLHRHGQRSPCALQRDFYHVPHSSPIPHVLCLIRHPSPNHRPVETPLWGLLRWQRAWCWTLVLQRPGGRQQRSWPPFVARCAFGWPPNGWCPR